MFRIFAASALVFASAANCAAWSPISAPTLGCTTSDPEVAAAYRLSESGRFEEARVRLASILNTSERLRALNPASRACLMFFAATLEVKQGQSSAAIVWLRQALDQQPIPAPLFAVLTANLASAYLENGLLDEAEATGFRAAQLTAAAFGDADPNTLNAHLTLAGVHFARGDYARAEPVCRRLLHILERLGGPADYEVAVARVSLAAIYVASGRNAQAVGLLQRAIEDLGNSASRRADDIPLAQAELALAFAGAHRPQEAEELIETALATAKQSIGPDHPSFVLVLEPPQPPDSFLGTEISRDRCSLGRSSRPTPARRRLSRKRWPPFDGSRALCAPTRTRPAPGNCVSASR